MEMGSKIKNMEQQKKKHSSMISMMYLNGYQQLHLNSWFVVAVWQLMEYGRTYASTRGTVSRILILPPHPIPID
jgi:hypothetical protein